MNWITIISIVLLVFLTGAVIWMLVAINRRWNRLHDTKSLDTAIESLKTDILRSQMEGLVSLRESFDSASRILNERLAEGSTTLDKRLDIISDIERKLGKLSQQTQTLERLGNDIKGLSELLKPPKVRGKLGEVLLEHLLSQILPPELFATQHSFANGGRVDAIIKLGERILPIDSKFPLESFQRLSSNESDEKLQKDFQRTLKKHINAIHNKYIIPDENTTPFALMYVPSEAVYYHLVSGEDEELFTYSMEKQVIPSSPSHLYAFLASLMTIHSEIHLSEDTGRLTAAVQHIAESLSRLQQVHRRMEGSARSLSVSLTRIKDELSQIEYQLEQLNRPTITH